MFKRLLINRALWHGALMAVVLPFQPALAQEVETGTEVTCSSSEQAQRYIALFRGDEEDTVSQVNIEAESDEACRVLSVVYLRGKDVAKTATKQGTFVVARVLIVGFVTRKGVRNVPQFVQYTVFKIDERMA
jgi:hypothetical protein